MMISAKASRFVYSVLGYYLHELMLVLYLMVANFRTITLSLPAGDTIAMMNCCKYVKWNCLQ